MNDIDPTDLKFSFNSFVNKYKNIPGIVYIEEKAPGVIALDKDDDNINAIFVAVDRTKITIEQLPLEYQLRPIYVIDAFDAYDAYQNLLDMAETEPDINKGWQRILREDLAFLEQKLEEYENR